MKPPPFAYECPTEPAEAVRLLAAHGAEARPLAGGQSLVPLLNFRLARPSALIDLNRIEALARIAVADDTLRLGAMARQAAVEDDPAIARRWPLLVEAIDHVAHPAIRSRGTVGGSLAHNDPVAELPAAMLALDATITALGPGGTRTIAAEAFFVDALTTALAPDELLTEIAVPAPVQGSGWSFLEVARRHGDFALAAVAVSLAPGERGCADARVVVTGTGSGPVRIRPAEAILVERGASADACDAAAAAAGRAITPQGDLHAPARYRRALAETLTRRACRQATGRMARP